MVSTSITKSIIDIKLFILMLFIVVLCSWLSYLYAPIIGQKKDALNMIVTVFSVLSGFLFLVMASIIEVAIPSKHLNSREKINQNKKFQIRFFRFKLLFVGYLVSLFLIFIYFMVEEPMLLKQIIEYALVFVSSISFIYSMMLPWLLKALILEKIELRD